MLALAPLYTPIACILLQVPGWAHSDMAIAWHNEGEGGGAKT
jgi:hypothetical protein